MGGQRRGLDGPRPPLPFITAALLAAASLFAQSVHSESVKKSMTIDISSTKLPDSAFWAGGDHDAMDDPIPAKYLTSHFGVLADGPASVSLGEHATLPLFVYFLGSLRQTATRNFPHAAHLVSVDPASNKIRLAALAERKEGLSATPESLPADGLPDGYAVNFLNAELRARLHLPWTAGRVITQVLLFDMESNRVETTLAAGADTYIDVEKERFLAEERAKQDPSAPFPARHLTAPAIDPPPPVPAEPGLALAAARVAVVDGDKPLPLTIAFHLPVFPEELVKPANAEANRTRRLIQPDGATPFAACLAIHLVVSASGEETPYLFTLHLPVETVTDSVAAGVVTIDLRSLPEFPLADQTVVIRAYAKDSASNAATIGIVDRKAR